MKKVMILSNIQYQTKYIQCQIFRNKW